MVNGYFDSLTAVIDQVAPTKTRLITIRPKAPWYTIDIDNEKKCRRMYERKWRRTKDPTDRNNYLEKCKHVNQMIHESKSNFYSSVISENKGNQRILFQTIDKLLHRKNDVVLPTSSSDKHLAERFADYFINKITTIHTNLLRSDAVFLHQPAGTESELFEFYPISAKSFEAIIRSSPSKCCCLDPLPTWLLKEHLHLLLPPITNIVNMSLGSTFPSSFKKSIIVPLLKKPSLDAEVLKHYRPVSNLAFISKIIEKAVVLQLNEHLSTNNLFETYQSAYRRLHSTETALLKVQNDILIALDNKQAVVLLLLDLSAAFDTVCHTTLLKLLKSRYGITGKVLTWMESYLTNRCQAVMINNHISSSRDLSFGVPQGSVLGPILFSLYISSHRFSSHSISSTLHALTSMMHTWAQATDGTGSAVRVVCLDYRKAFDLVDHGTLAAKIMGLRIPRGVARWVCDFLIMDRRQRVKLSSDCFSEWGAVPSGVPQGTKLGPWLFILMINDLRPSRSDSWKYVDDTTLAEVVPKGGQSGIQAAVDAVEQWSTANKLQFNANKCKELVIDFKKAKHHFDAVTVNSKEIDRVDSVKLLGVTITSTLQWNCHVLEVIKKANKRMYFLTLLKRANVPAHDIICFYRTCIRPVLEYCAPLYHHALPDYLTKDIERIQRRALAIITPDLSYSESLLLYNMVSLEHRRSNQCNKFFESIVNNPDHKLHQLLPPTFT